MTDKQFLLHVLSDGHSHTLQEILRRSFQERNHGLTVHSRAADLRADGHRIDVTAGTRGGVYQLVASAGAAPASSDHIGEEGATGVAPTDDGQSTPGERDGRSGPSGAAVAATPPAIRKDAGPSRSPGADFSGSAPEQLAFDDDSPSLIDYDPADDQIRRPAWA